MMEDRLARAHQPAEPPPAALLERLGLAAREPLADLGPEAPEEIEPRGGDARHRGAQHGDADDREDRVGDRHRDAGGHPAAQGEALHRGVEDVVRHHDAEGEAEGDRAPAPVRADPEREAHQRET